MSNWQTLFKQEIPHLFIFLETILQTGGAKNYRLYARPIPFKNINTLSGYYYQIDEHEAMIGLGISQENQSFVLYRKFHENGQWVQRYDYFNSQGIYNYFSATSVTPLLEMELLNMDPSCPILNLLYNYLSYEYAEAETGTSRTDRVYSIEKFLQKLYFSDKIRLSIKDRSSDLAITQVFFQINENEMDPVLNWEERRQANLYEYQKLSTTLKTKLRVHKLYQAFFDIPVFLKKLSSSIKRFFMRPLDNLKGILFYWTIGQFLSLFKFMRTSPLTTFILLTYVGFAYYYFTTPQNPYTAHIKDKLTPILDNPVAMIEDKLSFTAAAPLKDEKIVVEKKTIPTLVSEDSSFASRLQLKKLGEEFEKDLELPSQEGRKLEEKIKLSYPLQAEAAWIEIETYQWSLLKTGSLNNSANLKNYLSNELQRSVHFQYYLWENLGRFILDQSDIVLDKNNEQLKSDYYQTRAITLFEEMTQNLSVKLAKLPDFPEGQRITQLAQARQETNSLLQNLKANSDLFKQKNPTDSLEYRQEYKRQWEILFLQRSAMDPQTRKGLEIYYQYNKNTLWAIERFYSLKTKELDLIMVPPSFERELQLGALKRSMEGVLHFYKNNALSTSKEIAETSTKAIEDGFYESIQQAEKIEALMANRNQMSGLQRHENKSKNRY